MTLVYSLDKIFKLRSCDECNCKLVLNSSNLVCVNCGLIHDPILCQVGKGLNDLSQMLHLSVSKQTFFNVEDFNTYRKKRLDYYEIKHGSLERLSKKLFHIFSYLELPHKTKLRTLYLIRKNYNKGILDCSQLAIASLIEAIKEHKLLIPDSKIIETFQDFNMKITRNSAFISRQKLGFKARLTVIDYLKQYLSNLHEQNPELEYRAKECLELAKLKRKYQGNNPRNFAAAIISIVYRDQKINEDKKIKQVYLCKLFKISYPALRENKNLIYQELGQC